MGKCRVERTLLAVSSSQRSFLAVAALLGAFLIPLFTSSLRGLTHVLTCQEQVATPFTLIIPEEGPPQVLSSTRLERGAEEGLCGGLKLDLRARGSAPGTIEMTITLINETEFEWQGSADLVIEGRRRATFPISIGRVESGASGTDTVELSLDEGTHELGGSLLIGP